MRKIVRPRMKVDSGARQARHGPKERVEEGQAADSTTESDEPGRYPTYSLPTFLPNLWDTLR